MIIFKLSKRLGEVRMSQAELARRTGIRPNTINELYHDIAPGIRFKHLEKICRVLKCDICDLIELVQDPPKRNTRR